MVYLDNAATTHIDPEAIDIICKSLKEDYANPSALYNEGRNKFDDISQCKKRILTNLNAPDDGKIIFTSGGCEGNNFIIKGCVAEYYRYYQNEGSIHLDFQDRKLKIPHIITTTFEHHSVLNACKQLEDLGLAKITYIRPDPNTGIINPDDIKLYMSHQDDDYQTILVSIMWINNVLGTIQPIKDIGEICKKYGVNFHVDAVQAAGNFKIDLSKFDIDFMTISGHKFHAPKGIGFIYTKCLSYLQPLISGGGQEYNLRAGTENLPYIKSITYCFDKYNNENYIKAKQQHVENIKQIIRREFNEFKNCKIFLSSQGIGTFNIAFKDLISDMLVYNLGERGYMVSVGSACDNGNFEDSHVLSSVSYTDEYINGNIRITFNEFNTLTEIEGFIKVLKEEIKKMRGY